MLQCRRQFRIWAIKFSQLLHSTCSFLYAEDTWNVSSIWMPEAQHEELHHIQLLNVGVWVSHTLLKGHATGANWNTAGSLWTSGNTFTLRVTKLWHRLPREAVASSALEILKEPSGNGSNSPCWSKGPVVYIHQSPLNSAFCASVISYYQICFLYSWGEVSVLRTLTPGFHGSNKNFEIICFFQSIVSFSVSHQ